MFKNLRNLLSVLLYSAMAQQFYITHTLCFIRRAFRNCIVFFFFSYVDNHHSNPDFLCSDPEDLCVFLVLIQRSFRVKLSPTSHIFCDFACCELGIVWALTAFISNRTVFITLKTSNTFAIQRIFRILLYSNISNALSFLAVILLSI